jgi:hypothetical protein
MVGDLILNSAPTVDLQASTKKYVDDQVVLFTAGLHPQKECKFITLTDIDAI